MNGGPGDGFLEVIALEVAADPGNLALREDFVTLLLEQDPDRAATELDAFEALGGAPARIRLLRARLMAARLRSTLEDIRRTGVLEMSWRQIRDQKLGLDLASALTALGAVMPADLRATLRPGSSRSEETKDDEVGSLVAEDLVAWHDGQPPGSGAAWGLAEPFRLLSRAEIIAMDAEIDADPEGHPDWPENEVWEQVMTDDAGAYLVAVAFGELVRRRPGQPDEHVAASTADWIWDRVADFGGADPRPAPRRTEDHPTDLPAVPGRR